MHRERLAPPPMQAAAARIQADIRGYLCRVHLNDEIAAAVTVQRHFLRGRTFHVEAPAAAGAAEMDADAVLVQALVRGYLTRIALFDQFHAAQVIQDCVRCSMKHRCATAHMARRALHAWQLHCSFQSRTQTVRWHGYAAWRTSRLVWALARWSVWQRGRARRSALRAGAQCAGRPEDWRESATFVAHRSGRAASAVDALRVEGDARVLLRRWRRMATSCRRGSLPSFCSSSWAHLAETADAHRRRGIYARFVDALLSDAVDALVEPPADRIDWPTDSSRSPRAPAWEADAWEAEAGEAEAWEAEAWEAELGPARPRPTTRALVMASQGRAASDETDASSLLAASARAAASLAASSRVASSRAASDETDASSLLAASARAAASLAASSCILAIHTRTTASRDASRVAESPHSTLEPASMPRLAGTCGRMACSPARVPLVDGKVRAAANRSAALAPCEAAVGGGRDGSRCSSSKSHPTSRGQGTHGTPGSLAANAHEAVDAARAPTAARCSGYSRTRLVQLSAPRRRQLPAGQAHAGAASASTGVEDPAAEDPAAGAAESSSDGGIQMCSPSPSRSQRLANQRNAANEDYANEDYEDCANAAKAAAAARFNRMRLVELSTPRRRQPKVELRGPTVPLSAGTVPISRGATAAAAATAATAAAATAAAFAAASARPSSPRPPPISPSADADGASPCAASPCSSQVRSRQVKGSTCASPCSHVASPSSSSMAAVHVGSPMTSPRRGMMVLGAGGSAPGCRVLPSSAR